MTGTDLTPLDGDNPEISATVAGSTPDPSVAAAVQSAPARSPVWLVAGGAVVAILGFGLAQVVPSGWPVGADSGQISALQTTVQDQGLKLEALSAAPAAGQADISALSGKIDAANAALSDLAASQETAAAAQAQALAALADRVTTLEQRPAADGGPSAGAMAATESEVEALRAMVEALQGADGQDLVAGLAQTRADLKAASDQAAKLQAQLEQTAQRATGRAAMLQIEAALDAGGSFGAALDDLAAAGITVPDALRAASGGVPARADLVTAFADPSRAALGASLKATVGDSAMSRFSAFLRNQVGARSLTAHAGDDPDAILSRAEAALDKGDLDTVLAEIATLPEPGRAEMANWVAQAQSRLSAETAVAALADSLGK